MAKKKKDKDNKRILDKDIRGANKGIRERVPGKERKRYTGRNVRGGIIPE